MTALPIPGPDDPVIITGWKSTTARKTTPAQRHANQALSAARAPVEHGFSDLKNWTRLRLDPGKATILLRALLVLTSQHAPAQFDGAAIAQDQVSETGNGALA